MFVFVLYLDGQGGFPDDQRIHHLPVPSPILAKSSAETKPKTRGQADPQFPGKTYLPQCFSELVQGGCQFGLSREAVPYLGTSKGKGFLSLCCVLLGNLTSVLVLRRLREEDKLFLLNSSQRYLGARFLRDLKVIIFNCVFINCCLVFHPKLSNIGLIAASKLLFVTILAALFWSFCKC